MSPPTEAQLECELLRDELRESESRNDGLEETIAELTEELEASEQRYNRLASTITLIAKGVPSVAEYAELMKACEAASEYLRDTPGVDLSLIGPVSVMQTAIAAFGPPFVTRKPGEPTQEPVYKPILDEPPEVTVWRMRDGGEPTQEPDDES